MSATEPRRRWYAADFLEAQRETIERLTTRAASEPSASVEITRNAAGNAQFTVKVYAPSSADEQAVKDATGRAYDEAVDAYDTLNTRYPHVDPKAAK